jgi:hypothetical protein
MGTFTFNIDQVPGAPVDADSAKTFKISGPETLTQAQAQAIFEKQVKTGGLTGFKSGDVLNAATQVTDGLKSAQSQLTSGLSSLGASVSKATNGITSALSKTGITSGINPGNFVKELPALASIGNLNPSQVTGTLAQASKLLAQPSSIVSNLGGAGNFGLDVGQLEKAGYVKPGMAAKYVSAGQNSITSVLNSPSVWTGKDGVNQVQNMLNNPAAQSKVQQTLMTTGLDQVKSLGLPIDKLSAAVLGGVALNAAKDVTATLAWAKGQTATLSPDLLSKFNQTAKDASFAVNLVDEKLSNETLNIKQITGSVGTINRTTLNAAVGRVVGNDKIPSLNYTKGAPDPAAEQELKTLYMQLSDVENKANAIIAEPLLSDTVDAREARITALKSEVAPIIDSLASVAISVASTSKTLTTKAELAIANAQALIELLDNEIENIRRFNAALQSI